MSSHIVVIGAGVIGLQTALSLLESNFTVTLAAKHWPGDTSIHYTSPQAGGHWRSHASSSDTTLQAYETATFHEWAHLLSTHGTAETGLQKVPAFAYWGVHTPETAADGTGIWWRDLVYGFRVLDMTELPDGAVWGVAYTAFCFNPALYLEFLLGRCADLGVRTHTAELEELGEAFELPGCGDSVGVVNCTGMGARELVGDDEVFPTKGQTVLVRGDTDAVRFRRGDGWEAYVIRRPGQGTILGGSKEGGNWDVDVDEGLHGRILERCKELAPELLREGEFEVVSKQVGRRPSRKSGLRVEVEVKEVEGRRRVVCHHYGHSGAGYQMSIGSAREAVRIVKEALKNEALSSKP